MRNVMRRTRTDRRRNPEPPARRPTTDAAIRTHALTREFGDVCALDALSFDVPAGTIFGFLGPNGAGKTTTIRLLLGLIEPSDGRAEVLGFDSRTEDQEIRERTGALLEYPGIYERLSVDDNLEFYARVWRMRSAQRRERIRALLTHFDLWDRRNDRAGTLSHGMTQKLALARALLHHPEILFLDEPMAGLDPEARASLRSDIAALAEREHTTVFLTTHNLDEAERLCDRMGIIRDGRLLACGSLEELRSGIGRPRIQVVGRGFTEAVVEAVRADPAVAVAVREDRDLVVEIEQVVDPELITGIVQAAGGEVELVRERKASLEDAYLALMEGEA